MILVDTSIWIDFFNGINTLAVDLLEELIEAEEEVCISEYILTEVLQGFKQDESFELARRHLLNFPVYPLNGIDSYIKAAQLHRKCRKRGITIRKTADCIIAQTAIENQLFLLHNDADFDRIASCCPLKIYQK
ncbi:MAG: PIN domain nuclease [Thermodesulfobacteriota bacterium]|nr:PIN domain nuclease [Thermodesulfobacteriota bacterium]